VSFKIFLTEILESILKMIVNHSYWEFAMKIRYLIILFSFLFVTEGVLAKSPAPEQIEGAVTISTIRAKALMNQGVTFIDVRRITDYQASHIQWAVHLDLELDLTEDSLAAVVKKHQPVVFYCNAICASGVQ